MRTFTLQRDEDETGVSGTGKVAEGVQFSNGKCAMSWLSDLTSIAIYNCIEDVIAIHGHEGKTRVVWDNNKELLEDKDEAPDCDGDMIQTLQTLF